MKPRHNRLHDAWRAMWLRCSDPQCKDYPNYGGRGITVCKRWRSFPAFAKDMGMPPIGLSLDRIDNDGDYKPSNCRWASWAQQTRNTRRTRLITFEGKTLCVRDWEKKLGLSVGGLWHLFWKGWSLEGILTTPRKLR